MKCVIENHNTICICHLSASARTTLVTLFYRRSTGRKLLDERCSRNRDETLAPTSDQPMRTSIFDVLMNNGANHCHNNHAILVVSCITKRPQHPGYKDNC